MSPSYEDKRGRYKNLFANDFVSGNPKHDNPRKDEIKNPQPAFRDGVKPRDKFRTKTAPPPPEPPPSPEPKPYVEPIPDENEITSVYGENPGTASNEPIKDENEI